VGPSLKSKISKILELVRNSVNQRENRAFDQLREHYRIEKELAQRLRSASKEERRGLYTILYDELFQKVPNHPQLVRKANPRWQYVSVYRQMILLRRFLRPDSTFLEVGPGDCSLSREVAKHVTKVYAVDVSTQITKNSVFPRNFELIISDGCSVPVPLKSINIAYSNNLIEHLHPDDAVDHLRNIHKVLREKGKYICITPNRLSGPHDVSRYFDEVATGLHLKEYTITELSELFLRVGFSKISTYIGGRGVFIRFPLYPIKTCENLLLILPSWLGRKLSNILPIMAFLGMTVVATK